MLGNRAEPFFGVLPASRHFLSRAKRSSFRTGKCGISDSDYIHFFTMWHGRFQQATDELVQKLGESISFDRRLFEYDIQGSRAHAAVLQAAGVLTPEERERIDQGLEEIGREIRAGTFTFREDLEDIHMNIEAELTRRIGPAGAKLHTARSRNDQVATDFRLFVRDITGQTVHALRRVQRALVTLGRANLSVAIPGYTHLQRAQPVLLAHHLLAYVEMLERDAQRLEDSLKRINVLPLGSGAIAGSTIPLDRRIAADALHFPELSANSMDAVSDRDFAAEYLFCASLIGTHLSRLSEDLILWSSAEFGFIIIGDAFTTGSSLMPQKKNPDVCELTRGAVGRLYGNLMSLLTVLKGLPLTYNRDLQHDKEPVFDTVDTLLPLLHVTAAMLSHITINERHAAHAVSDPMLLATDVADYLVLKGLPFRQAHEVVGKLVARALELRCSLPELPLQEFQKASDRFQPDVHDIFHVSRSLEKRTAYGATAPPCVQEQLERWENTLPKAEAAPENS
jgi:argininosuccinate lyase